MATDLETTLEGLQTIGPEELGKIIGRSTKSIQVDATRRPETLPPRFVIPGTRKVRWRICDVKDWMDGLVQVEQDRREIEREFTRRMGLPIGMNHRRPVSPAHNDNARARAANAIVATKKVKR